MKRVFSVFIFIFCCLTSYAQSAGLNFHSFREKMAYVRPFHDALNRLPGKFFSDSLEAAKMQALEAGDKELYGEIEIKACVYAYKFGKVPDDSVEVRLKNIAFEADKNKLPFLHADIQQQLGDFYADKKHARTASIESYIAAYQEYKNFSSYQYPQKRENISTLGSAFYSVGGYDQALRYFLEAVSIKQDVGNNCALNNTVGLCYRHLKKYDSALRYFNKAYEEAVAIGNKPYIGIAEGNIGTTFFLQKMYDKAIPLLKHDIENSIRTNQLKNAVISLTTLATIYNYQHNYFDAELLLKKAATLGVGKQYWFDPTVREGLYKQLYIVYAAKKDFNKAYLYADSTLQAGNSATEKNNANILAYANDKLSYTQHKLESEKLQNQVNIARMELSKNRIKMITAIAVLSILIIILIFIGRLNNKIVNQKKQLEKLNAVKDRIFSIISHDLRSPVNSLVSFTQLLEQGNVSPEKLQAYVGVLKDNLGYTAGLMENLLNWARTQMQGYKPVIEKFDLSEAAKQTVGLLMPEANKKELNIVNTIPGGMIINADFNMVALLIRNLISNAIKYTPHNGTVTLSAVLPDRQTVQIKVYDTGIGISGELVKEFNTSETDQPIDSSPGTDKEKGTGLGLMLCKGFAGLMNGKLTLESTQGKGSCFTVELPV
jgi:signal transduction histidine kinase/tetratricopeptide (TPR) repeat protein